MPDKSQVVLLVVLHITLYSFVYIAANLHISIVLLRCRADE